jgi:hypothetical protein
VQEVHDFLPHRGGSLTTLVYRMRRASLKVVRQQQFLGTPQGGMDRGELLQDIGAVALVLDHALDSLDLTAGAGQALEDVTLGGLSDARGVGRVKRFVFHRSGLTILYTCIV